MDYNLEYKKVYSKYGSEYRAILATIFKATCRDNLAYFSFFSNYEIKDIKSNVQGKMEGYIDNAIKNIKGNTYTVLTYKSKTYRANKYTLIIEHDNRVIDYDHKTWRMGQSSNYLEFLVLKTADGRTQLAHYADMMKALNSNSPNEDRINLISRIIAKINIQFDSVKYAADGIKRTNEIVNEITSFNFNNATVMPSNYCNYCRLNEICMQK
ncbi:MAG: hypothetical protein PHI32_12410 [Dysgonamonadaceae bacterium]|nr:hypothetical protein [Dysgonamonadaceae bacterium]